MSPRTTTLALFVAFGALYLCSLGTLPVGIPEYPTWMFFADNREGILRAVPHFLNDFSIAKHPMYPVAARPLFWLGEALFSGLAPPRGVTLAVIVPGAIAGAAGVALAHRVLLRAHPDPRYALGFAALYGLGTAPWSFSSFPDTQVFTALFTLGFFYALSRVDLDRGRGFVVLAFAQALACWSSPQQIFLAVVPGVYWLLRDGLSAPLFRRVAGYSAALGAFWALPFYLYLYFFGPGWRMPHLYVKENTEFSAGFLVTVPTDFLLFSVTGPNVHPDLYTDPSLAIFGAAPGWWWLIAGAFVVLVAMSAARWRTSEAASARYVPGVLVFLALYTGFFVFFNPGESYLMAMICTFPWLYALHAGFSARPEPAARRLLATVVLAAWVTNLGVMSSVRRLAIEDPVGFQLDVPKPEPDAAP